MILQKEKLQYKSFNKIKKSSGSDHFSGELY